MVQRQATSLTATPTRHRQQRSREARRVSGTVHAEVGARPSILGATGALQERVRYQAYGQALHSFPNQLIGDDFATLAQCISDGVTLGHNDYNPDMDFDRDGAITEDDASIFEYWYSYASPLPAGQLSDAAGPDNRIGYAGYVFNPQALLYTVRHRHFDPALGRFLEEDPLRFVDGLNLYQYARSRALVFADALGTRTNPLDDYLDSVERGGGYGMGTGRHEVARQTAQQILDAVDTVDAVVCGFIAGAEYGITEVVPYYATEVGKAVVVATANVVLDDMTFGIDAGFYIDENGDVHFDSEWGVSADDVLKLIGVSANGIGSVLTIVSGAHIDEWENLTRRGQTLKGAGEALQTGGKLIGRATKVVGLMVATAEHFVDAGNNIYRAHERWDGGSGGDLSRCAKKCSR
jgi:RHS repeat-associated protein